jgi:hypothetical protein
MYFTDNTREEKINSQDTLFDYHVMVKLDDGMSWVVSVAKTEEVIVLF